MVQIFQPSYERKKDQIIIYVDVYIIWFYLYFFYKNNKLLSGRYSIWLASCLRWIIKLVYKDLISLLSSTCSQVF